MAVRLVRGGLEAGRVRRGAAHFAGHCPEAPVEFPSNEEYALELALGNGGLGRQLAKVGKFDEAETYSRAAVTADRPLSRFARFISRRDHAYLLMRLARYDEAEPMLEEVLNIVEQEILPVALPPNAWWGTG